MSESLSLIQDIYDAVRSALSRLLDRRVAVVVTDNTLTVQPLTGGPSSLPLRRLRGVAIGPGDDVVVMTIADQEYVLGALQATGDIIGLVIRRGGEVISIDADAVSFDAADFLVTHNAETDQTTIATTHVPLSVQDGITTIASEPSILRFDASRFAVTLPSAGVANVDVADGSITSIKIMDGTITSADLGNLSVGTLELIDSAVTAIKIADGNVGTLELADNAVTALKIADGNVGTLELADNAVTAIKIADGTVGSAEIADGSVGVLELADNSVTAAKIATSAVGTLEIADGSVTSAKLAPGTGGGRQSFMPYGTFGATGNLSPGSSRTIANLSVGPLVNGVVYDIMAHGGVSIQGPGNGAGAVTIHLNLANASEQFLEFWQTGPPRWCDASASLATTGSGSTINVALWVQADSGTATDIRNGHVSATAIPR